MINWKLTLHKLFFMHEWEDEALYETTEINSFVRSLKPDVITKPVYIIEQCNTCGTLKRKKIKL